MNPSTEAPVVQGEVITFYSYKGGTGRTMALANVACLLSRASKGQDRILVIDWDLEAPGLHHYFADRVAGRFGQGATAISEYSQHAGLVELFSGYQNKLLSVDWRALAEQQEDGEISALLADSRLDDHVIRTDVPNVHLLKAGAFYAGYASRMGMLDWERMFAAQPRFFTAFASALASRFRYVLIDSRTGLSDTSGICTMLLPEKLVVVFTPSRQSLEGVSDRVRRAVEYRRSSEDYRPLIVYPLPSRIDSTRDALRAIWRNGDAQVEGYEPLFKQTLAAAYDLDDCDLTAYFNDVQVQHSPDFAFGERIAVQMDDSTEDRFSVAKSYEALLRWVTDSVHPWESPERVRQEREIAALQARQRATPFESLNAAARRDWIERQKQLVEMLRGMGEATDQMIDASTELAEALGSVGQYSQAHQILSELLARYRETKGDEHPDTLKTMGNLASTLWNQGDLAGARALEERVLAVRQRVQGDEHPATLTSMANLAGTLKSQGDLAGARALEERVLAVSQRVQGDEHPATLTSMNNLASTLWNQGDLAGARALQERVLAVRQRVLGDEHPDTLTSMGNLASTLQSQGDLAGARTLQERVLAVGQRVLGDEHPDALTSMGNLASTLWNQGDLAGARSLEERVLAVRQRALGHEHPATLTSMANLASTLKSQGDLAGARALEERVLAVSQRVLGDEHPATLTSMGNLASTLWNQGDLAGARALEERVLAVSQRVLGDEHPDTLTSMNNLASTLKSQGDLAGARALQQRALAVRQRVLGDEHPDTLTSMGNLADLLQSEREPESAWSLLQNVLALAKTSPVLVHACEVGIRIIQGLAQGEGHDRAIEITQKLLDVAQQSLPANHAVMADLIAAYVGLAHDAKELDQAEELLRRHIAIAREQPQPDAARETRLLQLLLDVASRKGDSAALSQLKDELLDAYQRKEAAQVIPEAVAAASPAQVQFAEPAFQPTRIDPSELKLP
ncbi:MAG: tetratricopeptide repeat protein [Betaproteobacteria bacterium]|nr:tetratricopeptide repeat protein [Betaproteobacteria bacterium]